jgi:hypothetical protein
MLNYLNKMNIKIFIYNLIMLNLKMKDLLNHEHRWKLSDWIDENKLDWWGFIYNPCAIYLIEQNLDKADKYWTQLSRNPSALPLLKNNLNKID